MKVVKVLLVLAAVGLAGAGGFVYSGVYSIAADEPHWPVTSALIETLRERSIAARADGIEAPPDLDSPERIRRGAGNYDAMCAGCHLTPGTRSSEIRQGLYPQPPDLARPGSGHEHEVTGPGAAARQFWVIKHGVKMTAMPAWSQGGVDDQTIWDMVALLQQLPGMDGAGYAGLVAASEGHTHAGAAGDGSHDDGKAHEHGGAGAPTSHVDAPGTPPHDHDEGHHKEKTR